MEYEPISYAYIKKNILKDYKRPSLERGRNIFLFEGKHYENEYFTGLLPNSKDIWYIILNCIYLKYILFQQILADIFNGNINIIISFYIVNAKQ